VTVAGRWTSATAIHRINRGISVTASRTPSPNTPSAKTQKIIGCCPANELIRSANDGEGVNWATFSGAKVVAGVALLAVVSAGIAV
jgi:hypothetical protein